MRIYTLFLSSLLLLLASACSGGGDINKPSKEFEGVSGEAGRDLRNGLELYCTFEGEISNQADGGPEFYVMGEPQLREGGVKGSQYAHFTRSDYLFVAEPLIDGGNFTVSFWVHSLGDGHLFHVDGSESMHYEVGFILNLRDGRLTYMSEGYNYIYDYSGVSSFEHAPLSGSEWTMVTLTASYTSGIEEAIVKLYINGEAVDYKSEVGIGYQNVNYGLKFYFGGLLSAYGKQSTSGAEMAVDNLRVYSREFHSNEVKQLYNFER